MAFKSRSGKSTLKEEKQVLILDDWREKYPQADCSKAFQVLRVTEWKSRKGFSFECAAEPERFIVLESKKSPAEFEDDPDAVDFEKEFAQMVDNGVPLFVQISFMGLADWGDDDDFSCQWSKAGRGFVSTPAQPVKK